MKLTTISFFITGLITLLSCSNDKSKNEGFYLDTGINIFLKNSHGENLLNTTNYNSDRFKIYYKINGQKIEVNNPLMDNPKGYAINNLTNPISMGLGMNDADTELLPITYIEWNDSDTDTLKTYYHRTENLIVWTKIWLNDEEISETTTPPNGSGRWITIVKP